jgi:hypothetical protein
MNAPIRTSNIPLGTVLGEFIGNEVVGDTKSIRRYTRQSVIGPLETIVNSFVAGGGVIFTTKAQANSTLSYNANVMAWVIQDPVAGNNGVYQKSGASGTGNWTRLASLPYSFYRATNAGAGSANAIVASNTQPIASEDALVVFNITDANTSSTVTVALNGGAPLTIKTASDNSPAIGGFVPNMLVAGYIDGAEFRMISDQASSAIQAAAEAAQAAAESAVSDAQDAADAAVGATGITLFATKSAAEATTIPSSTKHLSLAGLTTPGVGPWRVAVRVASEPAHTAKLRSTDRYLPNGSTDSGNGGWWELRDAEASFAAFGPAANGSTDDTTILNGAIDYVSAIGGKLIVPPGDYAIDGAVLKSDLTMIFSPGARFIQPDAGSVTGGHVLYGSGTVDTGSAVALTGNVTTGSASVSMSAGAESAFPAGSYALLFDDDYVFGSPDFAGRNQEIVRISSTSSGTVNFARKLTSAYTTANHAKLAPLTPLRNVRIRGCGEVICGINRQYGIRLVYPVDCLISDGVTVGQSRGGGSFVFQTSYNSHICGCVARDGQSPGTGGTGYGVSFDESCIFSSVKDCYFENLRENTFTNRTRWCEFSHNMAVNMVDTGWNCHGAGSDYNVCRDNEFRDCGQGVAVGWSGATRADNNNLVENNLIYRCTNGINFSGNPTGPIVGSGNVARSNMIRTPSGKGINVAYQSTFEISGNEISDSTTATTGVLLSEGCTGPSMVKSNTVKQITTNGATGIQSSGSTKIMISHNDVSDLTGTSPVGYYVPSGNTDVRVQLNTAMNCGSISLAGAAYNSLNTWN